jgi:hypothetical protein
MHTDSRTPGRTAAWIRAWRPRPNGLERVSGAAYEKALEDGTLDVDAPTVQQAADVLAATEEGISDDFEPQEIPAAVAAETKARRAAMGDES